MIGKILQILRAIFSKPAGTFDVPSSRDFIPYANISYDSEKEIIQIKDIPPNIWLAGVDDTNSMDPVVDAGHTCILTNNFEHKDLTVGDVVVYQYYTKKIMHRIVKITKDSEGRIFTLRGDNTGRHDPFILRDQNIKWLLLGIIY